MEQAIIEVGEAAHRREPEAARLKDDVPGVHVLDEVELRRVRRELDALRFLIDDEVEIMQPPDRVEELVRADRCCHWSAFSRLRRWSAAALPADQPHRA